MYNLVKIGWESSSFAKGLVFCRKVHQIIQISFTFYHGEIGEKLGLLGKLCFEAGDVSEGCRMKSLFRLLMGENEDTQKVVCTKGTGTSFLKCGNQNHLPI